MCVCVCVCICACAHCIHTGHRCQLTRRPWGRVFSDPSLTHYTLSLFAAITTAWQHTTPTTHLPSVTLSRYDLFHAHMVLTGQNCTEPDAAQSHTSGSYPSGSHAGQEGFREQGSDGLDQDAYTTGLSLVFHCMETPAYHDTRFPYYLGHCQVRGYASHTHAHTHTHTHTHTHAHRHIDLSNMCQYG